MTPDKTADSLLASCRLWAYTAMAACFAFASLLFFGIRREGTHLFIPLSILLSGFLWIGTTALYRHSYVVLKTYIGKRVGTLEFLSTNLVVILFPITYWKIRREVGLFKKGLLKNR